MSELLGWALQALILTFGIYLFLRFVRTTRGSRLIRGMVVSVSVGVLGLWGVAKWLELEELNYVFESITGYVVVIFAILFQPELRRGIAQLGEHQLVGRLRLKLQEDVLGEVLKAVTAMAARKHGALIAFERESPLNVYVEGGVPLDSAVTRLGIESLFHPGSALHDGAVIIRKDRIAAASCLFPLTKNPEFSRLRGTRHRAALGLSEETDAVTIAASEETGSISICRRGEIRENIPPAKLMDVLQDALGGGPTEAGEPETGIVRASLSGLRQDVLWLFASLVIGIGILLIAHRDMSITEVKQVRLVQASSETPGEPSPGELVLLLPGHLRLESEFRGLPLDIEVTGTRGQLNDIGALAGSLSLDNDESGAKLLDLNSIEWTHDVFGLRYEWAEDVTTQVTVESYETLPFRLGPSSLVILEEGLDPRYQIRAEDVVFDPEEVRVAGPKKNLARLEGGELELLLQPLELGRRDVADRVVNLAIHESLAGFGLSLIEGEVQVTVPIDPATRDLGIVTKEIALVCMDTEKEAERERWHLPPHAQEARFTIMTSGLLPATTAPGSTSAQERTAAIRRFVDDNLVVFVDVAELPPLGEGRAVPVRWSWREDWRKSLDSLGLDMGSLGGREILDVRLDSEALVFLEESGS